MVVLALVLYRVTPTGTIDLLIGVVLGVGVGSVFTIRNRARGAASVRAGTPVVVAGVLLTVALVLWVASNDPTVLWFGHVVSHADRADPRVALTFDDGPDPVQTPQAQAEGSRGPSRQRQRNRAVRACQQWCRTVGPNSLSARHSPRF